MKNKIVASLLLMVLSLTMIVPFALADSSDLKRVPTGRWLPRFVDDEDLLTANEAEDLIEKLDEISKRQKFDVNVVVVHELDERDARDYADDFYEQNDLGYGSDHNGILLLLAMADRDYGIVAWGYGLYAFNTAGHEYLAGIFLPYLAQDEYYDAFMAYADAVDDFVSAAKSGNPYDEDNAPPY